jgi:hypothetical protein
MRLGFAQGESHLSQEDVGVAQLEDTLDSPGLPNTNYHTVLEPVHITTSLVAHSIVVLQSSMRLSVAWCTGSIQPYSTNTQSFFSTTFLPLSSSTAMTSQSSP